MPGADRTEHCVFLRSLLVRIFLILSLSLAFGCKPGVGKHQVYDLNSEKFNQSEFNGIEGAGNLQRPVVVLVFDNPADLDQFRTEGFRLAGLWTEFRKIVFQEQSYEAGTLRELLAKKGNQPLFSKTDSSGSYAKFLLEDKDDMPRGLLKDETSLLENTSWDDLLIVRKKDFLDQESVEIRSIKEVDEKVTGLNYDSRDYSLDPVSGTSKLSQNNRDPDSLGGLIDLLSVRVNDPRNPVFWQPDFPVKVPASKADIVLARIHKEFGSKYVISASGKEGNYRILRLSAGKDDLGYHWFRTSGTPDKPDLRGILKETLEGSLKRDDPDILRPGESMVFLTGPDAPDFYRLRKDPRFNVSVSEDPSWFKTLGIEAHERGRALSKVWHVERKLIPELDGDNSVATFVETLSNRIHQQTGGQSFNPDMTYELANMPVTKEDRLGKGGFGEVYQLPTPSGSYAKKYFIKHNYSGESRIIAREIAFQKVLGDINIGPRVHRIDYLKGQNTWQYFMDKAEGSAFKVKMNDQAIMAYAEKQTRLKELGFMSLDEKPDNILVQGETVYLHDFGFMETVKDGTIPSLDKFGTYAPKEAKLTEKTSYSYQDRKIKTSYKDHSDPEWKGSNLQSFYFAFNVLENRRFYFNRGYDGVKSYKERKLGRTIIDGNLYADYLQKTFNAEDLGFKDQEFVTLLKMVSNDFKNRPSVDEFTAVLKSRL